jgi:large subunit ribosomal protein L10
MSPVTKEQKAALVEELAERLRDSDTIFAVDYRGITVPQAAELRTRLSEAEATFRVVKNRLAKRAASEAGTEGIEELLVGPTALAFVGGDPVVAAKAIATFAREHDVLAYKGGLMDGSPLDPERFTAIARLPALEVLHGQLVGMAASPITGLARGLGAMLSGLAIALGQIQEQGLVDGEDEQVAGSTEQVEEPEAPEEQEAEQSEADPADPGAEGEESAGSDLETSEEPQADQEEQPSGNEDD